MGKVGWTRGEWEGSGCALMLCLSCSHSTSASHQAQTVLLGPERLPPRGHSCCGRHLVTAVKRALEGMFPGAIIWSKTRLGFPIASVKLKCRGKILQHEGTGLIQKKSMAKVHKLKAMAVG